MKKTDFITKMLELGAELEKAKDGMQCNMVLNDANLLYDRFIADIANDDATSQDKALNLAGVSGSESYVRLFKLECINEDGDIENNGYFLKRENAEKRKAEMDDWPGNKRYDIIQKIIEVETED